MQYPALIYGFVNGVTKPSGITSSVTGIGINFGPHFRAGLGRAVVRDMARMHRWDWTKGDLPSFERHSPGTEAVEWNLRTEERRVGKECVRKCRSRWPPYCYTKRKKYMKQKVMYGEDNRI